MTKIHMRELFGAQVTPSHSHYHCHLIMNMDKFSCFVVDLYAKCVRIYTHTHHRWIIILCRLRQSHIYIVYMLCAYTLTYDTMCVMVWPFVHLPGPPYAKGKSIKYKTNKLRARLANTACLYIYIYIYVSEPIVPYVCVRFWRGRSR